MVDANDDLRDLQSHVAGLLLANRGGGTDWGEMSKHKGAPSSKQAANRFLLCCLLDYQIKSQVAWDNGSRLIETILRNPDDIWQAITSISESEWNSKRVEYKLHRFPAAHQRLWRIGRRICGEYQGDARLIWKDKAPADVVHALWKLGAGDQISRMIVGALRDSGQVSGDMSDVKGDVYVRRVLGRAMFGKEIEAERAETAVTLAREMHPADPWQLDGQLWYVGNKYCRKVPDCSRCYLSPHCVFALAKR